MSVANKTWPKNIKVDKRIVKILSESTYENLPNALKEIIINSYDADATRVDIRIDLSNEHIVVEDNGTGMNEEEFSFYLRIAGRKREKMHKTRSGRMIIAQFGVGFLSSFPFFKNYYIESKKANSEEVVFAEVPCYRYFAGGKLLDVSEIDIHGGTKRIIDSTERQYTKITLSGFTKLSKAFFYPKYSYKTRRYSVQSYTSMEKLRWRLSEDLPIQYEKPKEKTNISNIFRYYSPNLPFSVWLNEKEIRRKVYGKIFLDSSMEDAEEIGSIRFKYFIATNKVSVHPYEARYLKMRNLNVGVGERETFGLGTEVGGARSRLHWLTGEVHVLEGLNEQISVSRSGFNYSEDYEKLKEFFIRKLAHFSNKLEKESEFIRFIKQDVSGKQIKNLKMLEDLGSKIIKYHENREIEVSVDKWATLNSEYPAAKLENQRLILNKAYPLFRGTKYTDVFIKIHYILLSNVENGTLSRDTYLSLLKDIMEIYRDYL